MTTNWEDAEQAALFEWAERVQPQIPELEYLFAIPNGGKRPGRTAAKMKRTGVKRGVPDISLAYPTKEWHGFYIELKAVYPDGRSGTPTPDQIAWIDRLRAVDYRAGVYYGWTAAARAILDYLGIENWTDYLTEREV